LNEDHDASDAELDDLGPDADDALRTATPPPLLPAPQDFSALPLEEQFAYVKPVLLSVIKGEYGPAIDRHDGFMRGGGARQKVRNSGHERGHLSQREVMRLEGLIRRWVRKNDRREQLGIPVYPGWGISYTPVTDLAAKDQASPTAHHPADTTTEMSYSPRPQSLASPAVRSDSQSPINELPSTHFSTADGTEASPSQHRLDGPEDRVEERYVAPDRIPVPPPGESGREPDLVDLTGESVMQKGPTAIDENVPGIDDQRARPSTTFWDLNTLDKIAYCTDVLLREAVLQLLLWRSSQRDALHLLPSNEEQRLHDLARDLASCSPEDADFSWVQSIIQLKLAVDRSGPKTAKGQLVQAVSQVHSISSGTRSRPRHT